MSLVAARFARVEAFRNACDLVTGLMSDLPRKNCWTIAEHVGHPNPDRLQNLLFRASWDENGVRDDLRDYVVTGLGDDEAMLVVDETGDVKKGTRTVGAQRQYTGTAGRVENAQVAVYLTYTTSAGHAPIDRELYLPKAWTGDDERLTVAGVPDEVEFATKPELARQMIVRALDAGVNAGWVAGDEVYGADPRLRTELEARQVGYVLAAACSHQVDTGAGTQRADQIAKQLPKRAWQQYSAGDGAKGPRLYQWALVDICDDSDRGGQRWLLIRRNPATGELAYYRAYSPRPVPLSTLVTIAGRRWTVEETFQAGKGLCGLDEHQVRTWTSWRRWTILSMLAHAFLAVTAARQRSAPSDTDDKLVPLTCNEIQHLINVLTRPRINRRQCLHWSTWRRQHQHRSRLCHYQHRTAGQV